MINSFKKNAKLVLSNGIADFLSDLPGLLLAK